MECLNVPELLTYDELLVKDNSFTHEKNCKSLQQKCTK